MSQCKKCLLRTSLSGPPNSNSRSGSATKRSLLYSKCSVDLPVFLPCPARVVLKGFTCGGPALSMHISTQLSARAVLKKPTGRSPNCVPISTQLTSTPQPPTAAYSMLSRALNSKF
ncbi:unnamed protein product [Ectocarpus fasciculatus]